MDFQEKNHRVLIVDDEPTIRMALAYSLGAAGYDVATANSLGSAKEALIRSYFPVVITDLHLSCKELLEGLEVLRHVRECSPKTGVIVMSGALSKELHEKARLLGASRCYEKPCDLDEMLGSVQELAGGCSGVNHRPRLGGA